VDLAKWYCEKTNERESISHISRTEGMAATFSSSARGTLSHAAMLEQMESWKRARVPLLQGRAEPSVHL